MHRFHHDILSAPGREVTLDPSQARHARQVLRLRDGEQVELFDGRGGVARATILRGQRDVTLRIDQLEHTAEPRPGIDVAVALPKGPRAADMTAALSQVGATRLIPLHTRRSIVDPRKLKLEKLTAVALESAKQCGRNHVMGVTQASDLDAVLTGDYGLRLIAQPASADLDDLPERLRRAQRVLILIGPEGGFDPAEVERARQAGCLAWALGPHILRIETAAPAAVAIARYLGR